jgi:MFS superfamily sulfate permease-like transporter
MALVNVPDPPRWFVLCADAIDDIDYTGAQTVLELADQLKERGIVFAVAEAGDNVRRELDRFGLTAKIGPDRYFDSLHDVRNAFHAATGAPG